MILLRSRIIALGGWSAHRDQIGFVPDPMTCAPAAQNVAPASSDANPYRIFGDWGRLTLEGRPHLPDRRSLPFERNRMTASQAQAFAVI